MRPISTVRVFAPVNPFALPRARSVLVLSLCVALGACDGEPVADDGGPQNVDSGAIDVDGGAVDVDGGAIDVDGGATDVDGGAIDVDGGAIDVDGGAIDVDGGAIDIDGGAIDVDGGAIDVDGGAIDVDGGAIDIDGGAIDVDGGAIDIDGGATDVDGGAIDVDGGAIDVDGGAIDVDGGAIDVDGGAPDAGPVDAGPFDGGAIDVDGGAIDAGPVDAGPFDGGAIDVDGGAPDSGVTTAAACFADQMTPDRPGANYDQFSPVIDPDCTGTRHQSITDIERVVFLGDSVTVGTPPTLSTNFYRSRVAASLAATYGLTPPSAVWRTANPITGKSGQRTSGDFASCAEWGGKISDLQVSGTQVADCFPESEREAKTLIVMTMGGNDAAGFARQGTDPNIDLDDIALQIDVFLQRLNDTLEWIYTPGRFPNGVHVVYANIYEYTDATGDLLSCPAASTAGFESNWADPEALDTLLSYANEEYLRLAVEYGADMVFMFEAFCGHGFRADDETGRCYRGPSAERWFDFTCIHPTPRGHAEIAELFLDVIVPE